MNINNQFVNIDDLFNDMYMHKFIRNDIFLSDWQIEVLNRYEINLNEVSSLNELIFLINDILEDDGCYEDLENVCRELLDFNYYNNTNK